MTVQTAVNQFQSVGIQGEFSDNSPRRVAPYTVLATGEKPPMVGYAFTQGTKDNEAVVGGSDTFLGVCVNPKNYANYKNLDPTMELKSGSIAQICSFGHIYVKSSTAVKPGYVAAYDPADGSISGYVDATAVTTAKLTLIPGAKFIQVSTAAGEIAILELNN